MLLRFYYAFTPRDNILINGKKTYLWQITRAFDGLMLSRAYVSKNLEERIVEKGGVKKAFNIPSEVDVISDSGAFTWRIHDKPPITPKELLDYYIRMGFDAGMHPDNICRMVCLTYNNYRIRIDFERAKKRFQISLDNAREIWNLLQEYGLSKFRLYGVIQGWDVESYKKCTRELIRIGYRHLAIGGLALAHTNEVREILSEIVKTVRELERDIGEKVELHVLGVTRLSLLPLMHKLGVNSFDSASWLRMAWTRGSWLWFDPETHQLLEFDVKLFPARDSKRALKVYKKDPPLPQCNCPICKAVGTDSDGIVWTRRYGGNQRNMSRGFHNLYHFYTWLSYLRGNRLKVDIIEEVITSLRYNNHRILLATYCVERKRKISQPVSPVKLYVSERIKFLNELSLKYGVDFGIVSAKYGLVFRNDKISYYDKSIKSGEDIDRVLELVVKRLRERGPWHIAIFYGTSKKYKLVFYSACKRVGIKKVIFLGSGILGEINKLKYILENAKFMRTKITDFVYGCY